MQPYSCTMQFANWLPFSQHLVQRYSESPAVPPNAKFLNLGDGKNFVPQTLHQVSATGHAQDQGRLKELVETATLQSGACS